MNEHIRTPMLTDKRFLLSTYAVTLLGVVGLLLGKAPSEAVVTAIVTLVLAFVAQSQYGQTTRTKALIAAPAADPAPVPPTQGQ